MRFTVDQTAVADGQLADVWRKAVDRAAVTAASAALDRRLADDPDSVGAVVFDTVRVVTEGPLTVEFEVRS